MDKDIASPRKVACTVTGERHLEGAGFNVFAYVAAGEGLFGPEERPAGEGEMVVFAGGGDGVSLAAASSAAGPLSALVVGGAPLREPVVRYGPFVMNTREEILQAIEDYQSGRMGRIGA